MDERRIIHEITPLMGKDVLYIADRHKKEFTYPIHNHEVFELNFVEHAPGVRRIVGDSNEIIGEYDLVLITSPDLEHVWEQNTCTSEDIREVTVQFDLGMSEDSLFGRNPFMSVRKMMNEARKGICFPISAIMKVYKEIDTLSSIQDGFYAVMQFMTILYELSKCDGIRTLASSSYAKVAVQDDSRRILKVKNFIAQNYMDELRLGQLADIAGQEAEYRILGVFADERLPELPDVPTLGELGYYEGWLGSSRCIVAPAGVSEDVVKFYEDAFKQAMEDPDYLEAAEQAGMATDYKDAEATGALIQQQQEFAESLVEGFWYDF